MTSTKVMSYSQSTTDVRNEFHGNRRNIGTLVAGTSSLSVRSSLLSKDKSDVFTFKIKAETENFGIVAKASGNKQADGTTETISSADVDHNVGKVRIQILDTRNQVIADSSPSASFTEQQAYKAAKAGALAMDAGTYVLKVTRAEGVLDQEKPAYAIQMVASKDYTKKYDTVEYAYSLENDSELASTTSALAQMLVTEAPDGSDITSIMDTVASNYANYLV